MDRPSHAPVSIADSLIDEISKLQIKEHSFYEAGQFPSQRGKHRREDNTVFFSALISFTLNGVSDLVEPATKNKMDSICAAVSSTYRNYQNATTGLTYNFWKTNPPLFFPNTSFLSHHSRFQLPDDADCSAIIYLTDSSLTHPELLQFQLAAHANKSRNEIKNSFKKYRDYKAYSTWFGKRMPIEFDICVQSNVLYFIYENGLTLTAQDSATVLLIKEQIHSGDYLRYAHYLSPSYKKRAIILYHLARLLAQHPIPQLETCKPILKKDIENELKRKNTYMDQILLSTALIRMNGTPPNILAKRKKNNELKSYVFFRADILSSYTRPWIRWVSKTDLFKCDFYCEAYCLSLLLENKLLTSCKHVD